MKIALSLLVALICMAWSCQKNQLTESTDPNNTNKQAEVSQEQSDCITEKIKSFKTEYTEGGFPARVLTFTSKGEQLYLFDEGMAVDLPAYVINNACDTICKTGGLRRGVKQEDLDICPEEDEGSREVIWSK